MSGPITKLLRNIRNNLIAGLLVMVPIGVTFVAFTVLFLNVDEILGPWLHSIVVRFYPSFAERIPGLGVLATVFLLYIAGSLTRSYVGSKVLQLWQSSIRRVPLFGPIYGAASQLMSTLASPRSQGFRRVVLVEFPTKGTYSLGFMTGKTVLPSQEERLHVFVPTAPLPTAGFLVFVRPGEVIDSNLNIEEAMRMIVSVGLVHRGLEVDGRSQTLSEGERGLDTDSATSGRQV